MILQKLKRQVIAKIKKKGRILQRFKNGRISRGKKKKRQIFKKGGILQRFKNGKILQRLKKAGYSKNSRKAGCCKIRERRDTAMF